MTAPRRKPGKATRVRVTIEHDEPMRFLDAYVGAFDHIGVVPISLRVERVRAKPKGKRP